MRELEEKKSKEALLLIQKKNILIRYHSERDKTRMLQRSGGSRVVRNEADTQDTLSSESCMSSAACDIEEMSSETSRRTQEKEETMPDGLLLQKDGWRLEPEGETETPEVTVWWNEAEGVAVTPEGASTSKHK